MVAAPQPGETKPGTTGIPSLGFSVLGLSFSDPLCSTHFQQDTDACDPSCWELDASSLNIAAPQLSDVEWLHVSGSTARTSVVPSFMARPDIQ